MSRSRLVRRVADRPGRPQFATARHADQYRESDHAPFITHPIEVARLLQRDRQPEHVIAAGLLHDVLEKTTTTRAELDRRFGVRIARLVGTVTDDPSTGSYEQRKRQLRDRVAHAESYTFAIFAADKISKVQELTPLPPSRLDEATIRAKLSHYQAGLEMLRRAAPDLPLVDRLDAELNRLVAPAITGTHITTATTTTEHSKRSDHRGHTI